MPDRGVVGALESELEPGTVVTDHDVIESYRYDRALTLRPGHPLAVVRAASTADVQVTLRLASRFGVPVVARGAGTGLSGGSAAIEGGITLSLARMRSISVDPAAMVATVQPGLLNAEVKAEAARFGLWYPPDPSSYEICSIGGNLATNAGGLCCVKYGVTTDYVLGLEVVLADGRVVRLGGRTVKDVAGYDLKRLFVGSEGTLGVITEATLRLRPRPAALSTVAASFTQVVESGRAVVEIASSMRPAALEMMDRAAITAVERVKPMGLGPDIGALLLGQSDAGPGEVALMAQACERSGAAFVAVTDDPDEGELLMGARRMAIPCVERLGAVLIEDVGVPIPAIPALIAEIGAVAERRFTQIPIIGHAGDGNFHPLVVFDPADPAAAERAEQAFDDIMKAALSLGGTISGEHGVGILKAGHLTAQLGEVSAELTRTIKEALDPHNILNPGKWV